MRASDITIDPTPIATNVAHILMSPAIRPIGQTAGLFSYSYPDPYFILDNTEPETRDGDVYTTLTVSSPLGLCTVSLTHTPSGEISSKPILTMVSVGHTLQDIATKMWSYVSEIGELKDRVEALERNAYSRKPH